MKAPFRKHKEVDAGQFSAGPTPPRDIRVGRPGRLNSLKEIALFIPINRPGLLGVEEEVATVGPGRKRSPAMNFDEEIRVFCLRSVERAVSVGMPDRFC